MGKIKPPVRPHRVTELRLGRNYVRTGDLVRVKPPEGSPPGSHGYPARFLFADQDRGGLYVVVVRLERNAKGVLVGSGFYSVKPERIERKASTSDPLKRAAAKKKELACANASGTSS